MNSLLGVDKKLSVLFLRIRVFSVNYFFKVFLKNVRRLGWS